MATKTLGLIHTSATLVPVFQQLCAEHLPGVQVFNIVDDSLVKTITREGALTPAVARRVVSYVTSAEAGGADYVLVTCSSIGAAVEQAAGLTGVPVLRVDQPMADEAVRTGRRIGVIATLPTTLGPTTDLVRRRAALAGQAIELTAVLCEGAFDALVAAALKDLVTKADVVLLAQASMARVVDTLATAD
ncbi:MAG: Asp/Glu/hydantoin racemase, partial [Hymenobacter sp.]